MQAGTRRLRAFRFRKGRAFRGALPHLSMRAEADIM